MSGWGSQKQFIGEQISTSCSNKAPNILVELKKLGYLNPKSKKYLEFPREIVELYTLELKVIFEKLVQWINSEKIFAKFGNLGMRQAVALH